MTGREDGREAGGLAKDISSILATLNSMSDSLQALTTHANRVDERLLKIEEHLRQDVAGLDERLLKIEEHLRQDVAGLQNNNRVSFDAGDDSDDDDNNKEAKIPEVSTEEMEVVSEINDAMGSPASDADRLGAASAAAHQRSPDSSSTAIVPLNNHQISSNEGSVHHPAEAATTGRSPSQDNLSSKSSSGNEATIINDKNFEENHGKVRAVQALFEATDKLAKEMNKNGGGIPEVYKYPAIAGGWKEAHFFGAVDNINRGELFGAWKHFDIYPSIEQLSSSHHHPNYEATAVVKMVVDYLEESVKDDDKLAAIREKNGGEDGFIFAIGVGVEHNGDPVLCKGAIHTKDKKPILAQDKAFAALASPYKEICDGSPNKKIPEHQAFLKLMLGIIGKSFDLVGANPPGTTTDGDNDILKQLSDDITVKGIKGSCATYKNMNIVVNQITCHGELCMRSIFALAGAIIGIPIILLNPRRQNKNARKFAEFILKTWNGLYHQLPEDYKKILMRDAIATVSENASSIIHNTSVSASGTMTIATVSENADSITNNASAPTNGTTTNGVARQKRTNPNPPTSEKNRTKKRKKSTQSFGQPGTVYKAGTFDAAFILKNGSLCKNCVNSKRGLCGQHVVDFNPYFVHQHTHYNTVNNNNHGTQYNNTFRTH